MIAFLLSTAFADQVVWSEHTAHTLPKGRWEVGLFGPLRYGLSESLELEIHPLWAIPSPHLAVKKDLLEIGRWSIAVRQSLSYPTPLLRLLARGGIGGVLAPDVSIPQIISSDTRLLLTKNYSQSLSVTMRAQLQVAPRFGESSWPNITVPVVYARTAAYQGAATIGLGSFINCGITPSVSLRSDTQLWFMAGQEANWAAEEWLTLRWSLSEKFAIDVGTVATIGVYDYGQNWHVAPILDVNWAID